MIESCQGVILWVLVEMCQHHAVKLSNWVAVEVQTQNVEETVDQPIDQKSIASLKWESMKYHLHSRLKVELSSPYWPLQVKKKPSLDTAGIARKMHDQHWMKQSVHANPKLCHSK